MSVAIIAAAIPALRPLWAESARQNQKNGEKVHRPNQKQRQSSIYVMMDQQMEADSLPSRFDTRITIQEGQNQGDVGSDASSLPDCDRIMKTSQVRVGNFRMCEGGQRNPENSSLSDEERRVEDVV